jgi:RNase P subunit RPR2
MPEIGSITSLCDNCQQPNDVSLNYFMEVDDSFNKSVIATCQKCNRDYIVTLGESLER